MRRVEWKSGLVWVVLIAAVSVAVISVGWNSPDARATTPPGHDARACGENQGHPTHEGPALPYELGDENLHVTRPDARTTDLQADGG